MKVSNHKPASQEKKHSQRRIKILTGCHCLTGHRVTSYVLVWKWSQAFSDRFRMSAFIYWLLKFSGGWRGWWRWRGRETFKSFTAAGVALSSSRVSAERTVKSRSALIAGRLIREHYHKTTVIQMSFEKIEKNILITKYFCLVLQYTNISFTFTWEVLSSERSIRNKYISAIYIS